MPRSLEPPLEPDEIIDGFRRAEDPPGFTTEATHSPRASSPRVGPTRSLKQPGSVLTTGRNGAIIGTAMFLSMVAGCTFAGCAASYDKDDAPVPAETVTVIVTETETVIQSPDLPASCTLALKEARDLMQRAASVASANDKQLDIMSQAYVAIFEKDTQALNSAAAKQRDLERTLSTDAVPVLLAYQSVMDGLTTCQ